MCLLCVVCVEPGATESSTIQACVFHVSCFEISCLERGSRSKPTSNILLSSPPLNLSKCRALPVVEKENLNCKHTMPRGQACIFLLSHAAESAGMWDARKSSIVTNERFCGKCVDMGMVLVWEVAWACWQRLDRTKTQNKLGNSN